MNNNLQLLYNSTLSKYKKFKSRFDKNVSSGHFYELSQKAQHQIITRLERLKRRLSNLKTQLKLALVSGALVFCLSTTTQAQQLGPFVQNDIKNPFPGPTLSSREEEVAVVDLDGDGDLDVVVGKNYGDILFFENVGTANKPKFISRTGVDNPFNGLNIAYYASPAFADLDGDGDFDLVLGTYNKDLAFFENTGNVNNPVFSTTRNVDPTPVDDISNFKYYKRATFTDIDGDGDLDIFTGENYNASYSTSPVVSFWVNDGTNNFTGQTGTTNPLNDVLVPLGSTINKAFPAFVDIDNDGDQDAFIGDAAGNIHFFRNEGTFIAPSFPAEITGVGNPLNGFNFSYNASPEFADLDNDGDFDIVLGTGPFDRLAFVLNTGTPTTPSFKTQTGFNNPFKGLDLAEDIAPTVVDLNSDGYLDVVIGEKYGQTLYYFENSQDGTFTEISGVGVNPFDKLLGVNDDRPVPAFADIDKDGDQDLFVTIEYTGGGPSEGKVIFFRNDGSNNFYADTSPIYTNQNYKVFSTTLGDFDDDGDFDAIIGGQYINYYTASLQFIRNVGTLYAPSFVEIDPGLSPINAFNYAGADLKPIMTDIDHDGDMDLICGVHNTSASGQLFFFQNNGSGDLVVQTGVASPFFNSGSGVNFDFGNDSHPALIDSDNDGDLDVLIGLNTGQITFLENTNIPPQVHENTTSSNFTEGDPALILDATLTLSDDTNDDIIAASIQIQNNITGEDVLSFTPQFGVTGSFDASTGILSLKGTAKIAQYEMLLQSVTYENTSISPNIATRNIQFSVTDFDNTDPFSDSFPEPIINVNIISVNSTPVVSASSAADGIYIENDTPGVIIDAGITVSDADNTSLQSATISIINNFNQAEDALVFNTQNGITGNYVSTTGVLTLSGASSVANYQTALRSVRYINTSEDPSIATRTIEFSVYDGTDNSTPATRNVQVVAVNDAPVLSSSNSGTLNYDQNTAAILVDDLLSISDVDNANLLSVTVTINGYQSGDVLNATPPSGITSNFDTGTGILLLSGSAPLADYIAAVQSTIFSSTGSSTRQIEFVANDGTDNSSVHSRQIAIILPNEAPVLSSTNMGTSVNYNQNGSAILIDNQITVSDVDDTFLEGLTVSINGFVSGDLLTVTSPNETNTNFNTVTGVLSITGTALLTDYETTMRTVAFSSSNGAGGRTIEFLVNDGDDNSNLYTRNLNISKATLPPVVNTTPGTTQVGSTVTIDLCEIIFDPDNTFDELTIIVVSILSQASTNISACDLTIDYSAVDFEGEDSIVLRATDPDGNSAENTLTITVEPIDNGEPPILPLEVFNAISPNGDGLNDWWEIVNLLTPNKIELYNRWGDLVKTLTDYKNIPDNSQMDDLPSGTYFYKIESPNGEYTGYISIKK
ncbi:MAG TPA: FG-GAP-like repeat-containing protein [Fulvivirga sp.]|nr:FG-GAP-like repeat-containing protein [Fulvivirga sp.]